MASPECEPVHNSPPADGVQRARGAGGATADKLPTRSTPHPKLYIIVNGKLAPDFDVVADGTLSIVARSFWTAVKSNTRNTLIATYEFARRNAWEFRATAIEREHAIATSSFNFDTAYLRDLFAYGYARGRSGQRGRRRCPGP